MASKGDPEKRKKLVDLSTDAIHSLEKLRLKHPYSDEMFGKTDQRAGERVYKALQKASEAEVLLREAREITAYFQ